MDFWIYVIGYGIFSHMSDYKFDNHENLAGIFYFILSVAFIVKIFNEAWRK